MFLVCDKITHLCRLSISWSYNQVTDNLPIDLPSYRFPGTTFTCVTGIIVKIKNCEIAKGIGDKLTE